MFISRVDSLDWKDLLANEINNRVTSKTQEGSIILFHNAAKHTPEALPAIIEHLQGEEYDLIKISDIIYKENFTLDHEGRQQLNELSSEIVESSSLEKESDSAQNQTKNNKSN